MGVTARRRRLARPRFTDFTMPLDLTLGLPLPFFTCLDRSVTSVIASLL